MQDHREALTSINIYIYNLFDLCVQMKYRLGLSLHQREKKNGGRQMRRKGEIRNSRLQHVQAMEKKPSRYYLK